MTKFNFQINYQNNNARAGLIKTAHGDIRTPAFMPVGTCATVKALTNEMVLQTGADIILGNTYHLMLRPSEDIIARQGGLHKFMNWPKPILTDSGGFQVMSLSNLRKITEQGVEFKSHIDGKKYMLSPEYSMEIQHKLGSTITMIFDECTPYPATWEEAKKSMELSLRWAERSKKSFKQREGYGIFGIVQGGIYQDLRKASIEGLSSIGFDGYAIGGLAVGEGQQVMFEVLDNLMPYMPMDKPRYLMGVGKPDDITGAVARGVDMFDCVIPTRSGRNGQIFTKNGAINIRNSKYKEDNSPIDKDSDCPASRDYSKAYLHHLCKSNEILSSTLLSWHNISFYQNMMRKLESEIV